MIYNALLMSDDFVGIVLYGLTYGAGAVKDTPRRIAE